MLGGCALGVSACAAVWGARLAADKCGVPVCVVSWHARCSDGPCAPVLKQRTRGDVPGPSGLRRRLGLCIVKARELGARALVIFVPFCNCAMWLALLAQAPGAVHAQYIAGGGPGGRGWPGRALLLLLFLHVQYLTRLAPQRNGRTGRGPACPVAANDALTLTCAPPRVQQLGSAMQEAASAALFRMPQCGTHVNADQVLNSVQATHPHFLCRGWLAGRPLVASGRCTFTQALPQCHHIATATILSNQILRSAQALSQLQHGFGGGALAAGSLHTVFKNPACFF